MYFAIDTKIQYLYNPTHLSISEFEELSFCNYEGRELTDELTRYHSNYETKYFKLLELNRLFSIDRDENRDVRNFILDKVEADIMSFGDRRKLVAHRSMIYVPGVIRLLLPYLRLSPDYIIQIYHDSITFANEYECLYEFKEIYSVEFKSFYEKNVKRIRKHIKELIFDDIGYYLDEEDGKIGLELDSLLNVGIEELSKQYNFKLTERYIVELENTFNMNFSSLRKGKKLKKDTKHHTSMFKQKEKEYESKPYSSVIEEYLPTEEDDYQPIIFLKENGYTELLVDLKKNTSVLSSLKDSREIFESVCHFIVENKIVVCNLDTYHLIEEFFNYYCGKIKVHPESIIRASFKIIEGMEQSANYSVTKSRVVQAFKEVGLHRIQIDDLSPILIPYNKWYRFGHSDIKNYVIAKYIDCFERDEFSRLVTESLWKPDDYTILQFLHSSNPNKLREFYVVPQLIRFMDNINFTSEQTMFLSFVNFFSIEFELGWEKKKKSFNFFSSSNSEAHYENLLHFLGIKFCICDFESYFVKEYQHGDTITKLFINTKILNKLYERVLETVPKKISHSLASENSVTVFDIKLFDFFQKEESFTIAKEIGMVLYIHETIQSIKEQLKVKSVSR